MKQFFLVILFTFKIYLSFSQGEIDTEHKILFRNEKSYGISLNTNGFGLGYRFAKHINIHKKNIYEGDFSIIKHEKEYKRTNPYSPNLFRFVYGKKNSVFGIRFGAGMQHELYRKFDRNSISIRWFYLGGITAAFLKPIYYQIYNDTFKTLTWQKFVHNTPWWYIYDKEPYLNGVSEMSIVPGIYAKTGFSFEFGKTDKRLNIIEAGISFDAYIKELDILDTEKNPQFIPVLFLTYRFGKVESGYYLKEQDEGTYKKKKK
ncbi:MAG: hypothetical protein GXO50_01400 [Chlorobi bacterium]|nr:hypothetical protein [Chlorobiota bacterium]